MTTDPTCQSAHEGPVYDNSTVISAEGQVQWAFVYVKRGLEGYVIPPAEGVVVLDQVGCMYVPHVFGLQTDQTLEILNSDATLHNIHALPHTPNKAFNIAHPNTPGLIHRKRFANPDVMVEFQCHVHPWMTAYGGVLPHSFFSVTDAAGTFAIPNLPPGDYTVAAWHETLGELDRTITIPESGDVTLDFAFETS